MGIAERRERERLQRQNDIIDTAERLFFSKGIENTTMDEVAELAELSKGTLYLYFRNKEDLYHAIVERGLVILLEMFEKVVEKVDTGIDRIHEIGRAYEAFHRQYPDYFTLMLHHENMEIDLSKIEEDSFIGRCNRMGNRIFSLIQEVVGEGMQDGSIRSDLDPVKLSLVVWGHATGIMQIIRAKKTVIENIFNIDAEEIISYSFELMRKYIESRDHEKGQRKANK